MNANVYVNKIDAPIYLTQFNNSIQKNTNLIHYMLRNYCREISLFTDNVEKVSLFSIIKHLQLCKSRNFYIVKTWPFLACNSLTSDLRFLLLSWP